MLLLLLPPFRGSSPAPSPHSPTPMARLLSRAARSPSPAAAAALLFRGSPPLARQSALSHPPLLPLFGVDGGRRRGFHDSPGFPRRFRGVSAAQRGAGKPRWWRRRQAAGGRRPPGAKERQLEIKVDIAIEEELPDDPEVINIAEMLRLNAPMAMKIAFDGLKDSVYKTRDTSISDIGKFERAELSLLLCNDDFIRKLNKEWRDEDHATDVLSMSQHIPELDLPFLMLGDIVISVETAARQAEERGHSLLDEIRILLVHGLLHLLGFDHELSVEAEEEMEKEEELILNSLGWKGKGLINSANSAVTDEVTQEENSNGSIVKDTKKEGSLRFYKPKFQYIFCDMDGTLLNSKSQINFRTAEALKEAISRGVKIFVATGKARPAVIKALKTVDLSGKGGIVSECSPGVFLQGLLVYGRQGREVFKSNLDQDVCREAFLYSMEHEVPLVAFCEDRCMTTFNHPSVESLHTIYHEPKAEVISSVEELVATADVQKLLFFGTREEISSTLRPYWSEATKGRAGVTQAQADMLEIIPYGTSKGSGVKMLLDHLNISNEEIMAIGDGENDIEMLQLASLGIALENGSEKTKSVADVIVSSNDDDGVAEAIYRYAF